MKLIYSGVMRVVLAVPCILLAPVAIAQEPTPSNKVQIESTSISIGIGAEWGEGTLTLSDGTRHPFSIKSLKIVQVGFKKVSATGTVHNLKKLSDFNGLYVAAQAGIAVGGGVAAVTMRNQNGVIINMGSTATGIDFALGPQGIDIKLK